MKRRIRGLAGASLFAAITGCGTGDGSSGGGPAAPEPLVFHRADLATAGLGVEGLRGPPPEADPGSAEDLWRLAVYNNYRGIVDVAEGGGFGRLFGPRPGDLPVPGTEYWALGRLADGTTHVMVLQVPDGFPGKRPCLVAAPASGSRGPLGAIGSAGDWGLRNGCAVVYTDKGAGPWVANLGDGKAYDITGVRDVKAALEWAEPFSKREWPGNPDVAVKHAHSGDNPEAHWGEMVLDSIRFALERLEANHRPDGMPAYRGDGIIVIAASISNGGAAVLAAAEHDEAGLIDGVVAGEPNVHVAAEAGWRVSEGGNATPLTGRPLYDFASLAAIYGPCATLAPRFAESPLAGQQAAMKPLLEGRCEALAAQGRIKGEDTPARAEYAYQAMLGYGLHPEAADAQVVNTVINLWADVAAVYANAYGRFEPGDRVCGVAFRAFDAESRVAPVAPEAAATLFATSAGVPPVAGIDLAAVDGETATKLILAPSKATGAPAYGLDQVSCLRELWAGGGERGRRVRAGVAETRLTGKLHGKPVLMLHGRSDALVWINHSSRSYFAANQAREGDASKLRYLEVTNAQHFDTLLGLPGFNARFVPLHIYFQRALSRMRDHLFSGAPLPPSQVIHTTPRGSSGDTVPALEQDNVPDIADGSGAAPIRWQGQTLEVPL